MKTFSAFALLTCMIASSLQAAPVAQKPRSTQPKAQKAALVDVKGKVTMGQKGVTRKGKIGMSVKPGDTVELLTKDSRAVILTETGTQVRLKGLTRIRFSELNRSSEGVVTRIRLLAGRIWTQVAKLKTKQSAFEINAGGVVCGVRGTTVGAHYRSGSNSGAFYNLEGHVFLTEGGEETILEEGTGMLFDDGSLGDLTQIPDDIQNMSDFEGYNNGDAKDLLKSSEGGDEGGSEETTGDSGQTGLGSDMYSDLSEAYADTNDTDSGMESIQEEAIAEIDLLFETPESTNPIGWAD